MRWKDAFACGLIIAAGFVMPARAWMNRPAAMAVRASAEIPPIECYGSSTLGDFFMTMENEDGSGDVVELNADFNLNCNGFTLPTGCEFVAYVEAWYSTSGGEEQIIDDEQVFNLECGEKRKVQVDVPEFWHGPGHYRLRVTMVPSNGPTEVYEDGYDL